MANRSASYVTDTTFKKESKNVHSHLDKLDQAVERLALAILQTREDLLGKMDRNMEILGAKHDLLLNQMTDFSKKTSYVLQNQEIHRGYIHDHEARLIALEKRPEDKGYKI